MDRAVKIRGGSVMWRTFRFQPPDPAWAPKEYLGRVRAGLRAYDPRVALWWGGGKGRWRLMEWIHSRGEWSHIVYWEGPAAQYRQPELGAMRGLLARLAQNTREVIEGLDEENERIAQAKRNELLAPCREYLRDIAERAVGGKIVVGAGGTVRKRDWLKGEAVGHHRKFVVEHLRKQNALRNGT